MIIVRSIDFNFYVGIQNFCFGKANSIHCLAKQCALCLGIVHNAGL